MMKYVGLLLLMIGTVISSCDEVAPVTKDIEEIEVEAVLGEVLTLPDQAFNYGNPELPSFFNLRDNRVEINTPNNNPITDAGATLGRVLFYDVSLSANNSTSCASCHLQKAGFSDSDQFSKGFEGELTNRNSMGLTNSKYYENGHFFWDERAETLEEQVLMPIQDPIEMGLALPELESKISALSY
ncbi:MAG: cytochrome-c peroxidase [Balneolaceae bacterium]